MSHSLGAKLSGLRHKGYITDIEYQRLKKALEQEPIITSTEDNAEMIYPQVEGITPTVVEPIPDVDKKIESYKKLLKHPVIKSIMGMDETQEQLDFVQSHKKIPVTLTVGGDLISRETVCDYIAEFINHEYSTQSECEMVDSMIDGIQHMPSVKPQERTGHWEWVQYDYNPKIGNWHCTECRCIVVECVDKNEKGGIPLYKYCPQCGAKMEVEKNG